MIFESKYDILENNRFEVDFGCVEFNALKNSTSYIKIDTNLKLVIIDLLYTKEVFRLNKSIQKGLGFDLTYYIYDDNNIKIKKFNDIVTISSISFNLSKNNDHQPTITLVCNYI